MILTFNQSIDLPINELPESLNSLLYKISQQHYEELYEEEADGTTSLEDDLKAVLEAFSTDNQTLNHLRYVWMALILVVTVEPTIKYYQPSNSLTENSIMFIISGLLNTINLSNDLEQQPFSIDEFLQKNSENYHLPPEREIPSLQITNEAINVFYSAILVLDYKQAITALLDILDACLEGYAIFPGSDGRRDLFNWWLLDVVPASWKLLPPKSLYLVGIEDQEEIKAYQTNLLKEISFLIR